MAVKFSCGTLLYRQGPGGLEVLLVHPAGNYNRAKPWSIPKGNVNSGETDLQAAQRETLEETGVVTGELIPLGEVRYRKSGKRVVCFAGPAPVNAQPSCASWEVDRAEFVELSQAEQCLHPDQLPFLKRLRELLA